MFRNKSVQAHQFAMVPDPDIPRSSFLIQKTHKTTFDAGLLIPVYCEEILPGDSFNVKMTAFGRLATPLHPIMDNLYLESFFFFVPNRLVWDNWVRFMGEQDNPADSISYVVPSMTVGAGDVTVGSMWDHFGLPTTGQVVGTYSHITLPFRAYNLIWNQWFRDENLQNSRTVRKTDGGDVPGDYVIQRRGKRHDYFTSCLPWPQKGNTAVQIPLGTSAIVRTDPAELITSAASQLRVRTIAGALPAAGVIGTLGSGLAGTNATGHVQVSGIYPTNLYADLSTATAATINQLRQAFQIQRLLERDARGGTRYTELIWAHFKVKSPDARLQRPEYLGGGKTPININPVPQTSATGLTGGTTPTGELAAMGTLLAQGHGFNQSFTEHGYIIGLVCVDADLTYQQGVRKMWSRSTKYDFYWPAFAMLGEQTVTIKELYCKGDANDALVFGYQERWAEYRYNPSQICGLFRSTAAGTIDAWHLAQKFTALPSLNATFIQSTPPLDRIIAVGSAANGQQLLLDCFFDCKVARPIPMYSVPGMVDHF